MSGFFITVGMVSPIEAQSWKGKEVTKDGIRRIVNPAQGMEPRATIRLEERWRIGGDSEGEGEVFGIITGLAADRDGFVYVMDYQLSEVKKFSPEGDYIKTIGREGEGPGELRRPSSICLSPQGLVCVAMAFPSRIVKITGEGEPAGTITIPEDDSGRRPIGCKPVLAGDHLVLHCVKNNIGYLCAIDEQGHETVSYYEEKVRSDDLEPVYEEKSRALFGRWDAGGDGRVYVASSFYGYEISVFDPGGGMDYVFERDYEHRKRSSKEKQLVYDWANVNPNGNLPGTRFEIEDHDKDIMSVFCRGDGTCWVLTSRGFYDRPGGSVGVFDVFDQNGRFVRQVTLLGEGDPFRDRYYFFGGCLYVVTRYVCAIANMFNPGGEENKFSSMCADPTSVIKYEIE